MTAWLDDAPLPPRFARVDELEAFLTRPARALAADLAAIDGDILVLGVGGKMGPTLARLARNAAPDKRVIGVARFSEPGLRETLDACGVETIACDLLDRAAVQKLPQVRNVIFMAGRKFGAQDNPALTWAMNVHVPAIDRRAFSLVAHRRVLDRLRLSVRRHRRRRRGRRHAAAWTRRICANRASAASGCLSFSRSAMPRPAGCFASTTRSTCATACCSTSPARFATANRLT